MFVGFLSSSLVAALKDHSHAGGVLLMPRKLFNAENPLNLCFIIFGAKDSSVSIVEKE